MTKKSPTPDMLTIYKSFYDLIDKPGVLPIIQYASSIFNAPIIFTDDHYHLISLYPPTKIGDIVYDTLLESGSLPIDTIAAFQESYLGEPGKHYNPFFAKDGLVQENPRIFAEVYDEDKILGHIGIFVKTTAAKLWQLEAASILTSTLRIKLNLTNQSVPSLSNNLNILLDRNSSSQDKDRALFGLTQAYNKSGILLVAPLTKNKAQMAFAPVAINYCLNKFPNAIPSLYNNDFVILITDKGNLPLSAMQKTTRKISDFLSQYKLICSAVYPVTNLHMLPNYYLQGRLTALYKLKEKNSVTTSKNTGNDVVKGNFITYYDEIMPEQLYLYLSEKPESAIFIHPCLKAIKTYDKENETEFFITLKTYCQCLFQKNETAALLHIHRNTLLYRLNRMEELFTLDLNDSKTLHYLLISFKLDEYFQ